MNPKSEIRLEPLLLDSLRQEIVYLNKDALIHLD